MTDHTDRSNEAEPQPGTYWERAVLRRFINSGPVDTDNVRSQVHALLTERDQAQDKQVHIAKERDMAQRELDQGQDAMDDMESDRDQWRSRAQDAEAELEKLNTRLNTLQDDYAHLDRTNLDLRVKLGQQYMEGEQLRAERDEKAASAKTLFREWETLTAERDKERRRAEAAEAMLNQDAVKAVEKLRAERDKLRGEVTAAHETAVANGKLGNQFRAERDSHEAAFKRASSARDSAIQERDALQARIDAGGKLVVDELAKERVSDMVGYRLCRIRDALYPYVPPGNSREHQHGQMNGCDATCAGLDDSSEAAAPFHPGDWVRIVGGKPDRIPDVSQVQEACGNQAHDGPACFVDDFCFPTNNLEHWQPREGDPVERYSGIGWTRATVTGRSGQLFTVRESDGGQFVVELERLRPAGGEQQ